EKEAKEKKLVKTGIKIIPDKAKIITYSSSGSVTSTLIEAIRIGKKISVIISEARPMFEGKKLAIYLSEYSVPVKLVIDAALPFYFRSADMVLVGADWIAEEYFINKIGTGSMAKISSLEGIPFYVIATTDKILSDLYRMDIKDFHSPSEIMEEKFDGIEVENLYFEEISSQLVSSFITDEGILGSDKIKRIISATRINPELVRRLQII
ncbi:hypothetical protein DRQ09_07680, partial [candidate division KSB1 bacterium]